MQQIPSVFSRLAPCTTSADALENFKEALESFADEARQCAAFATQIRKAFNYWGSMVGELHACSELMSGTTNLEAAQAKLDMKQAEIDKTFQDISARDAKTLVSTALKRLENSEKRLGEQCKCATMQFSNLPYQIRPSKMCLDRGL